MRKQYTLTETASWHYRVTLYHDGVEVEKTDLWIGDSIDTYLTKLEQEGYTQGYPKAVVDEAYRKYIALYENMIVRSK